MKTIFYLKYIINKIIYTMKVKHKPKIYIILKELIKNDLYWIDLLIIKEGKPLKLFKDIAKGTYAEKRCQFYILML